MMKAVSDFLDPERAGPRSSRKYSDADKTKTWPDDISGTRPGRNIEDVEREFMNRLFEPSHFSGVGAAFWRSPLGSVRTFLFKRGQPKDPSADGEGTIDPITNRRVVKSSSANHETATKNNETTQKSSSFTPKFEDVDAADSVRPPKSLNNKAKYEDDGFPQDAHKYGAVKWNEPDGLPQATAEEKSKNYSDLDSYRAKVDNPNGPRKLSPEELSKQYTDLGNYKAVRWNEPDGLQRPNAEEESKNYTDLNKYAASKFDDPNRARELTPEEKSKLYEDLGDYNAVRWNEPDGLQKPTAEESSKQYDDLNSYGAVKWNEPDGLQKQTPEEATKNYDDLHSYGAVKWNEPDGLQKQTPEELTKNYDDLDSYKAVKWNEPDGLPNKTHEELSKEYDDLHRYGEAVRWNEPDGLQKPTAEELSKNYDDLDSYSAVRWNEPDGLRKLSPEELSKAYEDLHTYGSKFQDAKKAVLDEFEARNLDTTPRHDPFPKKVEGKYADPSEEYKDLGEYGPVRWNEPDGLRKLTPEEMSKAYEDLHSYGQPVKWNEPDGLPFETPEEASKHYKDVDMYAPRDHPGIEVVRRHPEEISKEYTDLNGYGPVRWNEPDGLRKLTPEEKTKMYKDVREYSAATSGPEDLPLRMHPEEASKQYKDLDMYAQYDKGDGSKSRVHPEELSKQYKDLDAYSQYANEDSAFRSGRAEHVHPEELTKNYKDLGNYSPKEFDSVDQSYPVHPEEATKKYNDLGTYGAVRWNEPDGLPSDAKDQVASGLNAYDAQKAPSKNTEGNEKKDNHRKLTGNYARDFPEEFTRSWSVENSPTKASLLPKDQADELSKPASYNEDFDLTMDESFPRERSKLEPALDRDAKRRTPNPVDYVPAPMSQDIKHQLGALETTHIEPETESDIDTATRAETKADAEVQTGPKPEANLHQEPAIQANSISYKILAYDPSTDSVRIAETTSAKDHESTLSPAEVLPLLSNPAIFLPHFASLHAQGYEIASGKGNTLVFRKVRAAAEDADSIPIESGPRSKKKPGPSVNPIDMMGKPVTGNFASPTGFVNYDNADMGPDKPAPPFTYNNDRASRSEPEKAKPNEGKKKRSAGRKVAIGAAWATGVAYAISTATDQAGKGPSSKSASK